MAVTSLALPSAVRWQCSFATNQYGNSVAVPPCRRHRTQAVDDHVWQPVKPGACCNIRLVSIYPALYAAWRAACRRSSGRCSSSACCRALPEGFTRLGPQEQARVAAKERASLRLGDLSEVEREQIASQSDLLGPYRTFVQLSGLVLLFGALQNAFFLALRALKEGATALDVDSVGLALFLLAVAAGLLYAGNVWMAAPTVPTMNEVIQGLNDKDAEDGVPNSVKNDSNRYESILGTWYYGNQNKQAYTISKDSDGVFRFNEKLDGEAYKAVLSPRGRWLAGNLAAKDDRIVGTVCVRCGNNNTAVSYFLRVGDKEWSNRNVAYPTSAGPEGATTVPGS